VFLGAPQSDATGAREGSKTMVASVVGLAVLSLLAGLLIFYPSLFVQDIVAQIGWWPL